MLKMHGCPDCKYFEEKEQWCPILQKYVMQRLSNMICGNWSEAPKTNIQEQDE